jgi:hypothetical protein
MFEAVPQELKDKASEVLRKASREAYELLPQVEKLIDDVSSQLDKLADDLDGTEADAGGSDEVSPQQMFDYITQNSAGTENASYNSARQFLLSNYGYDTLVGLYESKRVEVESPFESNWNDWFKQN